MLGMEQDLAIDLSVIKQAVYFHKPWKSAWRAVSTLHSGHNSLLLRLQVRHTLQQAWQDLNCVEDKQHFFLIAQRTAISGHSIWTSCSTVVLLQT